LKNAQNFNLTVPRSASGVLRPPAVFVFMDTVNKVVRDAGVECLVGALQNIDNPDQWLAHGSF
jgi:hypothetical protein